MLEDVVVNVLRAEVDEVALIEKSEDEESEGVPVADVEAVLEMSADANVETLAEKQEVAVPLDDDDTVDDVTGDVEADCEGEEESEPAALGEVVADADAVIVAVVHAEVLADIVALRAPEPVEVELIVTVTVELVEN